MKDFLSNIIEADFMPHGHCYFWKPEIVWLNVSGDVLIAMAYYSLPLLLFYFAKKRTDLTHKYVFWLFAAFIFACGTTHIVDIWTIWVPTYRLEGVLKLITGLLSVSTAVVVYKSVPALLALPSHDQLKALNEQLQKEIEERRKTQDELRRVNEELEKRVEERTHELQLEVHERATAQQELQHINRELKIANNDLDNFVYCASHDLKAPIINIEGLLDVLKEEMPAPDEKVNHILKRLDGSLERINRTIHDLTEVSFITQKQIGVAGNGVSNFAVVLEEVEESVSGLIEQTDARIEADFADCPEANIQRKDLKSIMYNLLTNALKYKSPERKPIVNFSTKVAEDYIVLCVTDNGMGVELRGNEKKMFNLFKRLHDHVEGSGVGLYIVRRIIENYNGTIEVASEVGVGTTFTIRFPYSETRADI
ncbi:HAMP domain-containing sensor histidine kinase [uncultured Pontibacter sp.]|uniref:sensor histidine kinase n=1 Tax=uncultured Pontibacter sp. TaxID=453356 RepID=UPI00262D226E|nr:HAMP domain-containing sensor histidine kinase [uncultured Pontibacter sp.]